MLGVVMATTPASATATPKARLVHCGDATCLRISGRRPHSAVRVRIADHDLVVEGNRSWRATVPLATARDWASAHDGTLTVTLTDAQSGLERVETVTLPPGALGRRIELATLTVSAY